MNAPGVEVRCPMRECRRRVDLTALAPGAAPCLHFVAAWGGSQGDRAAAVLRALAGNREFQVRNLRPAEVNPARVAAVRDALDHAVEQSAHVVEAGEGMGALFADQHERNRVAFEFAQAILGPDPAVPVARGGETL